MESNLPPIILRRVPTHTSQPWLWRDHFWELEMGGKVVATLDVDYFTFMTLWMAHDVRTIKVEGLDEEKPMS